MEQKNGNKLNSYFELLLYAITIACFIYFLVQGNNEKVFQAALTIGALLLIRLLFKLTKFTVFPALRFSILLFILIAMILAKEFDFYGIIPHLDKIEHFFSGVILTFVGMVIFKSLNGRGEEISPKVRMIPVLFSIFFSIAMAGCWEIYEFTTDRLLGLASQNNSLVDTMGDIICGTLGGVGAGIYLFLKRERD